MGFFSRIKEWFMGLFKKDDYLRMTSIQPQIGDGMMELINEWRDIYSGNPSWLDSESCPETIGFAQTVCSDIASKAVCEVVASTGVDDTDKVLQELISDLRGETEEMLAKGAVVARPYYDPSSRKVRVAWYPADRVVPLTWEAGRLMSAWLLDFSRGDTQSTSSVTYCKVEAHVWSAGTDTITVKAFTWNGGALGNEVPLSTISAWADIEPGPIEVKNLSGPLFVYAKTQVKNYIDGSPVGVSIFASALPILEEMDKIWNDASWEREAGRAKAFVDETMIPQKIVDGKIVEDINAFDRKYYKKLAGNVENTNKLFEVHNPQMRLDQYQAYMDKQTVLACKKMHLDAKAFTVDVQGSPVTAQQILTEKNDTYTTILDIQNNSLLPALKEIYRISADIQYLYGVKEGRIPAVDDITITFGDSVMTDEETEKKNAQTECQIGLRSKLSYLMQYRNMSEEDALKELERIKAETPVVDYFGESAGA